MVLTIALVVALMIALADLAFAQGHPSCFGTYARSEPGPPPGPGSFVSSAATAGAGEPGSPAPGSATGEAARTGVQPAQQARQEVCPLQSGP
jgi:hypothetical protein